MTRSLTDPWHARRRRDPQPRRARAAGRDRQLVRAPAGQAPRRRAGRVGDGLELRGPLPQRAYLPRAAADPSARSTRCRCSCSATTRRDGLGGRARGRRRRRPDRHQHGLPGAQGVQDRAPARRCSTTQPGRWRWRGRRRAAAGCRSRSSSARASGPGPERARGGAAGWCSTAAWPGIAIHPRHASQRHKGSRTMSSRASWSRSCRCRCSSPAGCRRAEPAREAFEQTGAAAVLLARGSLGNPWLFEQVLGRRVSRADARGDPGRARLGDRPRRASTWARTARPATCASSIPGTSSACGGDRRSRPRCRPRPRSRPRATASRTEPARVAVA